MTYVKKRKAKILVFAEKSDLSKCRRSTPMRAMSTSLSGGNSQTSLTHYRNMQVKMRQNWGHGELHCCALVGGGTVRANPDARFDGFGGHCWR
jgi:hypothetical protein